MAIGMYTDLTLVLNLPDDLPEPTFEAPLALEELSMLLSISNVDEGIHETTLQLKNEDGRDVFERPHIGRFGAPPAGGSVNLIIKMQPFTVHSFGRKDVVLQIDGQPIEGLAFHLRRGQANISTDTHIRPVAAVDETPAPASTKKASRNKRTPTKRTA